MSEAVLVDRVLDVSCNNEHYQPADACRVRLTRKVIQRILELATLALEHKVASIRDWSSEVVWGVVDDESGAFNSGVEWNGECFRSECDQVAVYANALSRSVYWTAYQKHTDIKLWSAAIELEELEAIIEVGASEKPCCQADNSAYLESSSIAVRN